MVDDDSIVGSAGNPLGGPGLGNGNFTGQAYSVTDITPPTVAVDQPHNANPTNAKSVQFDVTFSENVTGVDVGDFVLATTGTAAGTIASVSGSGSTYTVTVNGVSGDGTLGLNLVDNDSIVGCRRQPAGRRRPWQREFYRPDLHR